jgi:hypothetical protein
MDRPSGWLAALYHIAETEDCVVRRGESDRSMSALGQKQTSPSVSGMSALPPKADIDERDYETLVRVHWQFLLLLKGGPNPAPRA